MHCRVQPGVPLALATLLRTAVLMDAVVGIEVQATSVVIGDIGGWVARNAPIHRCH